MTYSFPDFELVCCSMSSSNCFFLTHIQFSLKTDKVVWYSHLFKKFPQFVVIHTVKGFNVVDEAEVDVFLELPCFLHDPTNVGNLFSDSSNDFWIEGASLVVQMVKNLPAMQETWVQSLGQEDLLEMGMTK